MSDFRYAQRAYSLGMQRDVAREAVPENGTWNLQDFIPDRLDSPLRARGGWTNVSSVTGAVSPVLGINVAPFAAGEKLIVMGSTGTLGHMTISVGTWTSLSAVTTLQNPIFHRELVIVAPAVTTNKLKKFDGTTVADLHASAPGAQYATVYRDRVVAGNLAGAENRVQFGPDGNPASTWDTTFSWIDSSFPVRGLHALKNAILVFHDNSVEVIRGSIPPGTANTDMSLEPLFIGLGSVDPRSIIGYQENVIWADREGVYMTDGTTPLDLTKAGLIKDFWRERMTGFVRGSWSLSAGIVSGLLMLCISDAAGVFVDCFVCDLGTRVWWRFKNFNFSCIAPVSSSTGTVYAGRRDNVIVVNLNTILDPTSGNRGDGTVGGTPIAPLLETGYYRARQLSRFHEYSIGYRHENIDGTGQIQVSYSMRPEGESYMQHQSSNVYLADAGGIYTEALVPIRRVGPGFCIRLARTGGGGDVRLYGIKVRADALEGARYFDWSAGG